MTPEFTQLILGIIDQHLGVDEHLEPDKRKGIPPMGMTPPQVARMARQLMDAHGLTEWRYRASSAKRRYGSTTYSKKTISISVVLAAMNTEDQTRDTILHEIAHALVGKDVKSHGPEWKAAARKIGARPVRAYDGSVLNTPPRQPRKPPKYIKVCPVCGPIGRAYSRRDCSCGRCSQGTYNRKFKIIYKLRKARE
jgi:predicted SprT family Zn-dependent metalloprotease